MNHWNQCNSYKISNTWYMIKISPAPNIYLLNCDNCWLDFTMSLITCKQRLVFKNAFQLLEKSDEFVKKFYKLWLLFSSQIVVNWAEIALFLSYSIICCTMNLSNFGRRSCQPKRCMGVRIKNSQVWLFNAKEGNMSLMI